MNRLTRLLLSLLLIAAAVPRLTQLGRESLWGDEIVHARAARMADVNQVITHVQVPHSVGYPLVLHYWMKLGGSDAFIRLLSGLSGTACVAMLFMLGQRFGNASTGWLALVLIALSSSQLRFSREAAPYSLQSALVVGAVLVWLAAMRRNGWGAWLLLALLAAGSHYVHPLGSATLIGLYGLSMVAWVWGFGVGDSDLQVPPRSFSMVKALLSFGAFALLALPQMLQNLGKASQYAGSAAEPVLLTAYFEEVWRLLGGNWHVWTPLVWLPFMVGGVVVLASRSRFLLTLLLGWAGGTFAVWVAFATAQSHYFDYHYFISFLPAFVLLAALGMETCSAWIARRISPAGIPAISASLAVLVGILLAPSLWAEYRRHWTDYRAAGDFLSQHLKPEDRYYIKPERYLGFMIDYYVPAKTGQRAELSVFFDPAKQSELGKSGGAIHLVSRTPPSGMPGLESKEFRAELKPEWGSDSSYLPRSIFVSWIKPATITPQLFSSIYRAMKAHESDSPSATDLLEEAKQLAQCKEWDLACDGIIRAASQAPHLYAVLRAKSDILMEAKRFKEAIPAYEATFTKAPAKERWWMLSQKATALGRSGRMEEAVEALRGAIDEPEAKLPYLYRNLGENLFNLQRKDEAAEYFRKCLDLDPKSAHSLIRLGDISSQSGDKTSALACYEKAVSIGGADQPWAKSRLDQARKAAEPPR